MGPSCAKARDVLISISGSECVKFMLKNPEAFICLGCDSITGNILKYEQKLNDLRQNVIYKVSKLFRVGGEIILGKRQASSGVETESPQTKAVHTDSSTLDSTSIESKQSPDTVKVSNYCNR